MTQVEVREARLFPPPDIRAEIAANCSDECSGCVIRDVCLHLAFEELGELEDSMREEGATAIPELTEAYVKAIRNLGKLGINPFEAHEKLAEYGGKVRSNELDPVTTPFANFATRQQPVD